MALDLVQHEEDAYGRGMKLSQDDLALACCGIMMRLRGTWGTPIKDDAERGEVLARQRGLDRAWDERFPREG